MNTIVFFLPENVELEKGLETYTDLDSQFASRIAQSKHRLVRDNKNNDLLKTLNTMPRLGTLVIWELSQIEDFEKFYYAMLNRSLDQILVRVIHPDYNLVAYDEMTKKIFDGLIALQKSKLYGASTNLKQFGCPPIAEEKVSQMVKDRKNGLSYAKIAKLYGVARSTAQKYTSKVKIEKKIEASKPEVKPVLFDYKTVKTGAEIPSEIHSVFVMFLRSRREDSTRDTYLRDFKRLIEYIKNHKDFSPIRIEQLSEPIFFDYFDYLNEKGYKGTYIRRIIAGFRAFFNYAMKKGVARSNPTVDIQLPYAPVDDVLTNPLTMPEIERIIQTAKLEYTSAKSDLKEKLAHRNLVLIYVLVSVGMRGGSLLKLRAKDFTFEKSVPKITLRSKGSRTYKVSMDQKTGVMLDTFIQKHLGDTPESLVFFNRDLNGNAISHMGLNKMLKLMGKKAGISNYKHIKSHSFRVTFATMQDGKLTSKELQKRMGHASMKMTERYKKIELRKIENEWLPSIDDVLLEKIANS